MIRDWMTERADAAAQRYGALTEAWRSLYQRTFNDPRLGAASQLQELHAALYEAARPFIETEGTIIASDFATIVERGATATGDQLGVVGPIEIAMSTDDALSALMHAIIVQIERDAQTVVTTARQDYLQVDLTARAREIPKKTALLQHQIGGMAGLNFLFRDRRNARHPSQRFIRGSYRHALLTLYNETVLTMLAENGVDQAQVEHSNPEADVNGMIVSIAPISEHPAYGEVRDAIFHPNSEAILRSVA